MLQSAILYISKYSIFWKFILEMVIKNQEDCLIDLKPAILCSEIINAIEDKYSIDFIDDFFTSVLFLIYICGYTGIKEGLDSGSRK